MDKKLVLAAALLCASATLARPGFAAVAPSPTGSRSGDAVTLQPSCSPGSPDSCQAAAATSPGVTCMELEPIERLPSGACGIRYDAVSTRDQAVA